MITTELAQIEELMASGMHEEAYSKALALTKSIPDSPHAFMAAAYASDRLGYEEESVIFYERVLELGLPDDVDQCDFFIGYGSSLRNISRENESLAILRKATIKYPEHAALHAFLALALYSCEKYQDAMGTMLYAALLAARDDGFEGYSRALREYCDEFIIER